MAWLCCKSLVDPQSILAGQARLGFHQPTNTCSPTHFQAHVPCVHTPAAASRERGVRARFAHVRCMLCPTCETHAPVADIQTRYVRLWAKFGLNSAEIQAKTADGTNVALGKPCSASSEYNYGGPRVCAFTVDGDLTADIFHIFASGYSDGTDYMTIDLGGSFVITTVVFYARGDCCQNEAEGAQLQLIGPDNVVTAQRIITTDLVQTYTFSATEPSTIPYTIVCEDSFQGGGWALVRRVKNYWRWHLAFDDLAGFDVYGTYGTATSDSTFSIAYSSWITSATEMLFITGLRECTVGTYQRIHGDTLR